MDFELSFFMFALKAWLFLLDCVRSCEVLRGQVLETTEQSNAIITIKKWFITLPTTMSIVRLRSLIIICLYKYAQEYIRTYSSKIVDKSNFLSIIISWIFYYWQLCMSLSLLLFFFSFHRSFERIKIITRKKNINNNWLIID